MKREKARRNVLICFAVVILDSEFWLLASGFFAVYLHCFYMKIFLL